MGLSAMLKHIGHVFTLYHVVKKVGIVEQRHDLVDVISLFHKTKTAST